MNSAVEKESFPLNKDNAELGDISVQNNIKMHNTNELVIALCGPIGSPLHDVATTMQRILQATYHYDTKIIKLSDFIKADLPLELTNESEFDRIKTLIEHGNKMRSEKSGDYLIQKAIFDIHKHRGDKEKENNGGENRFCHIIDSIKNPEELELLRSVYREVLHVVGVFSTVTEREKLLEKRGITKPQVSELIDTDSGQEIDEGQKVEKIFPQSDYFMRVAAENQPSIETSVERFLKLIFSDKINTPTKSENAMYAAAAAAVNSACLSRQVGAVVTDSSGEIIASGWNDVPKAFGGLYSSEGDDKRCWTHGKCHNDDEKHILADKIIGSLQGIIPAEKINEAKKIVAKDKKLKSLIEFSRSIHAEMHALINALPLGGDRVRGGKLYVTTYPCHNCARHIIASGITQVYYLEPYKKSLALRLHDDALCEDENTTGKVQLLPYEGVAPSKYLKTFSMRHPDERKDKNTGKFVTISTNEVYPKHEKSLLSLNELEKVAVYKISKSETVDSEGKNGN